VGKVVAALVICGCLSLEVHARLAIRGVLAKKRHLSAANRIAGFIADLTRDGALRWKTQN
jgi:hypothetical protein